MKQILLAMLSPNLLFIAEDSWSLIGKIFAYGISFFLFSLLLAIGIGSFGMDTTRKEQYPRP